jgi:YHS domain-containing protein
MVRPSSLAVGEPLAVDAAGRPGKGLEALCGDRLAAADARPEGAVVESIDRGLDERELLVGPVAQGKVALLREDLAGRRGLRAIGHLVGRNDGGTAFLDQTGTLGEQGRAEGLEIEGRHGRMVREPYTPWEYCRGAAMAIEIDPVCGMEVDTDTSVLSTEHEGKTYWFCSRGCLLEFKDDPEKYLASDYEPTM